MSGEEKPRFKANWLTLTVDRQDRTFRVYVVEPRSYSPKDHPDIFWAALQAFLFPVQTEYLLGAERVQRGRAPASTERFDLLTFPEAFLPSNTLLECLRLIGENGVSLGCVHAGLRPPGVDEKGTHLFQARDLVALVAALKQIPKLHTPDLDQFDTWLRDQAPNDRFNVGCLFTVDVEKEIRVCLHPKLVKSKFDESALGDKNMKEGNLLSLVTLKPADKNLSLVTIQPLICSDVLDRDTDNVQNHPIQAITSHRPCLTDDAWADHVDIVSVATCTPTDTRSTSVSMEFEWKQAFRKAFERAAGDDSCHRHHYAAFVLSNFRTFPPQGNPGPAGLSGVFVPLPLYCEPFVEFVSIRKSVFGYFPESAGQVDHEYEQERWAGATQEIQKRAAKTGLGYIVALDPEACRSPTDATMFGFTITRLPRDANRWKRVGGVYDLILYDAVHSTTSGEPKLQFTRRTNT